MSFTKGQKVVQVQPAPIEGTVVGFGVDQQTGAVQIQVEWVDADADGTPHTHARYFTVDELRSAEA
jgi:hypothetical protein